MIWLLVESNFWSKYSISLKFFYSKFFFIYDIWPLWLAFGFCLLGISFCSLSLYVYVYLWSKGLTAYGGACYLITFRQPKCLAGKFNLLTLKLCIDRQEPTPVITSSWNRFYFKHLLFNWSAGCHLACCFGFGSRWAWP